MRPDNSLNELRTHKLEAFLREAQPRHFPNTVYGKQCQQLMRDYLNAVAEGMQGKTRLTATRFEDIVKAATLRVTAKHFAFEGAPQFEVENATVNILSGFTGSGFFAYVRQHGQHVFETTKEGTQFLVEPYAAERETLERNFRNSGAADAEFSIRIVDRAAQLILMDALKIYMQNCYTKEWEDQQREQEKPIEGMASNYRPQNLLMKQDVRQLCHLLDQKKHATDTGNTYENRLSTAWNEYLRYATDFMMQRHALSEHTVAGLLVTAKGICQSAIVGKGSQEETNKAIVEQKAIVANSAYTQFLAEHGLYDAEDHLKLEEYMDRKAQLDQHFVEDTENAQGPNGTDLANYEISLFERAHYLETIERAHAAATTLCDNYYTAWMQNMEKLGLRGK